MRLGNTNGNESQLEGPLEFNRNGEWGTICSDEFDHVAAHVACRQMDSSYEGATYRSVHFNSTQTDSPVLFNRVKCRGGESHLKECSIQSLTNESKCQSSEIVYLDCTAPEASPGNFSDSIRFGLPTADGVGLAESKNGSDGFPLAAIVTEGIGWLEIKNGTKWEKVCAAHFSSAGASVACKQLGYEFANSATLPSTMDTVYVSTIRGLQCFGNETTLNHCNGRDCEHDQVLLSCVGSEVKNVTDSERLLIAMTMNNVTEVQRLLSLGLSPDTTFDRCCGERFWNRYLFNSPAIVCAACYGSSGTLKALVRHGANVNAQSNSQFTAFEFAIRNDDLEMMQFLFNNGADISSNEARLLVIAASYGNIENFQFLIQHGLRLTPGLNFNFMTPLMSAAERGELEMVKFLVSLGEDIDGSMDWDDATAIAIAAKNGHLDVVKYLADLGADLEAHIFSNTLLMLAVESQNKEMVSYLVEKGLDVNDVNYDGFSATALAAKVGNFEIIKYLIENGADVNEMNNNGNSLLTSAILGGNLEMVKYVLELGADVNGQTYGDNYPLFLAAREGHLEIVEYLIELGANLNIHVPFRYSAIAVAIDNFEMVKVLVDNGADVNALTFTMEPLIILAIKDGNFKPVKYLIDNGAEVNAKTVFDGETPLMVACQQEALETVKYLLKNGADINSSSSDGKTPLFIATDVGNFDIVQYLVDQGANVHAVTNKGQTLLMYAAMSGNLEMVKYFHQLGIDVNAVDIYSNTAADYAVSYGYSEITSYLATIS